MSSSSTYCPVLEGHDSSERLVNGLAMRSDPDMIKLPEAVSIAALHN